MVLPKENIGNLGKILLEKNPYQRGKGTTVSRYLAEIKIKYLKSSEK